VALAQLAAWPESAQPQLLWIHAASLNQSWDAPLELRAQYSDEDDPPPSPTVTPPEQRLSANHDPDALLSLAHAYAGQVAVIDRGLDQLLAAIDALPGREELILALTSPRGYPLGEHGRVGRCDDALYSELLNVPLLLKLPGGEGALLRTQELIQPPDLYATLLEFISSKNEPTEATRSLLRLVRDDNYRRRQLALASGPEQRVIRTAAWHLRVWTSEEGELYELFTKPDDRWDFNDVASRCADIIQQLLAQAEATDAALPDELTSPWR
jgi:arylsulfatase A-like enzyme